MEFKVSYLSAIPTPPNYRLGPLDGSPCDTLGLDNYPLCNFRWEQEDSTLSPLRITFTDLSSYEPATWHWDFGDGTTSQDTSPVHEYAKPGVYKVCLVVSNAYSADTFCQTLYLGVPSGASDPALQAAVRVSPNPFSRELQVTFAPAAGGAGRDFYLYNPLGRLLRAERLSYGLTQVETADLPAGLYFWSVEGGQGPFTPIRQSR